MQRSFALEQQSNRKQSEDIRRIPDTQTFEDKGRQEEEIKLATGRVRVFLRN